MTTATLAPPEAETALGPGKYPDISFIEYQAINAVNNSLLKQWAHTPAEAREAMLHPKEPTAAFRTGDACHTAVFEPKRFKREYARCPKWDLRTNKGKAAKAEWETRYPHIVSLSRDEYDMACGMRDAVWAHPLAADLLKSDGENEVTILWNDEQTGLLCKARLDRMTSQGGWTFVVDLKTCKKGEASVEEWPRVCAKFHYHQQAAWYLDGLNTLAPHERRFVFLAVEKEPPYLVAHHEADDPVIAEGRARYRAAFEKLVKARETGEYPGYPVGIEAFGLPAWAYEYTSPPR